MIKAGGLTTHVAAHQLCWAETTKKETSMHFLWWIIVGLIAGWSRPAAAREFVLSGRPRPVLERTRLLGCDNYCVTVAVKSS